jgi:predicted MFS family arabinose efflux permease
MLHSLRAYPGFRVHFFSTVATNASFWMWHLVTGWLALVLTDSPLFVGVVGFLGGIPLLIASLPAGVVIDRVDRRLVLLLAQTCMALVTALVVLLLWRGWLASWHLLVAVFLVGTAMSFVFPTRSAMVADLVERDDLANAVALNAAGQNAPRVIGPALAGPLVGGIGITATVALCALLQLAALGICWQLPSRPPRRTTRSVLGSFVEGLAVIWRSDYLLALLAVAAFPTMLIMPYVTLLPVFARHELGMGSSELGLLMALGGLGGLCGSLAVAGWRALAESPRMLLVSVLGFGLAVLAFAHAPSAWLAALFLLLAGFIGSVSMSVNNTLLQLHVEDEVRGRVLSVYLLTWGLLPLGALPAGAIADAWGAPVAVTALTLLALGAVALSALRFPILRARQPVSRRPASLLAGERPGARLSG